MRGKKRKRDGAMNGFEAWGGYMNAKITKLEEQFSEAAANVESTKKLSNIFEGVSIFVNGYTEPSAEELKLIMMRHGGIYHHYQRPGKTSHVIASNLPNAKMNQLKSMKVVKPEWISESVAAGRLLDYKEYLLFSNPSAIEAGFKAAAEKKVLQTATSSVKPSKGVAKTAVDAEFLSEFYNNSRLHHLSTMGAMFKQYVGELKEKHNGTFAGRDRLVAQRKEESETTERTIMHIDMDCFFVSVALRNHPELKGEPIAVTHAKGNVTRQRAGVDRKFEYEFYRKKIEVKAGEEEEEEEEEEEGRKTHWTEEVDSLSEIASCSYEARAAGVCNGMYLGSAFKLCPTLKLVSYDFEGYKQVSFALYDTIAEYSLDVEAVSCDELFVDCGALLRATRVGVLEFVTLLRREVQERTGCPCSAGVGGNKLQARLATKRAKPNGQFHLTALALSDFMLGVDVNDLPGVGRSLNHKMKALNVQTCEDLHNVSLDVLKREFGGKTGEMLYKYSRGIDERTVNTSHQRKSVSAEVNYGIRFTTKEEAAAFFKQLSKEVSNRLKEIKMKGRNVTLKLMVRAKDAPVETAKFLGHGACDYMTRSTAIGLTDDAEVIGKVVMGIYEHFAVSPSELRGIGIQMTKLEACGKTGTLAAFLKPKESCTKKPEDRRVVEETQDKLNLPPASQLDRDVLKALPDDIRLEIMDQYGLSQINESEKHENEASKTLSYSQIDQDILAELPEDLQEEIETRYKKTKNETSPWEELGCRGVRTMVREWVKTEQKPRLCDVEMLAAHLRCLVDRRNIEDVDLILRGLWRHVKDLRVEELEWCRTYVWIVEEVQGCMRRVFGKQLAVETI